MLHWSEVYKTGHPDIDAQNKCMIDVMNVLHEAVETGSDYVIIEHILTLLEDLTPEHFELEEGLMKRFNCPMSEQNRIAHQEFLKMLGELRETCSPESFNQPETVDLYYEIIYWLKDHILSIDIPNLKIRRKQTASSLMSG